MASEVGSGQVAIFPVFKGFRSKVNSEVEGAGRESSSRFGKAFSRGSSDAGRSGGKAFSNAFDSGTGKLGQDATRRLTQTVATASRALSKARLSEQDAAAKVRVAEAALNEARSKGTATSSRVVAAEERLASAQRKLEVAQDKTKGSSNELKTAQQQLADATEDAGASSTQASSRFARGWQGLKSKLGIGKAVKEEASAARAEADRGGKSSGGAFANAFKGAIGALAAVAGVQQFAGFLKSSISEAANLEQSVGAIETVFKGSSSQMLTWSKNAATSVGLTQNEFNELGTLIGTQLRNGGTAMDELAPKTNDLIGLGADLSSMFGGSTKDAVDALSSALKGERDPIERYGVSLNQAKIDAEAAALGFEKVGGSLSTEAQQAATLSLIMKQTGDAHGNFAKESNTLAGQQQRLNALWQNAKTSLGTAFLPAVTSVVSALVEGFPKAEGVVTRTVQTVTGGFRAMVAAFQSGNGDVTSSGFAGVMEHIGNAARTLFDTFGPALQTIGASFGGLIPHILGVVTQLSPLSLLFQALTPILPTLATLLGQVGGTLGGILAGALVQVQPLIQQLVSLLTGVFMAAAPALNAMLLTFSNAFQQIAPAIFAVLGALMPLVTSLVSQLVPIITSLVAAVLPPLVSIFGSVVNAIAPLITMIAGLLIPIIQALMPVVVTVFGVIANVISAAMTIVQGIIQVVTGIITGNWSSVWQGILNILRGVWNLIRSVISGAINIVKSLIQAGLSLIRSIWTGIWNGISSFLSGIWRGIQSLIGGAISGVRSTIDGGLNAVRSVFTGIFNGIVSFVGSIPGRVISGIQGVSRLAGIIGGFVGAARDAVSQKFGEIVSFVAGVPGRIISGLGNLGGLLLNSGRSLMQGFLDGINGMIENIVGSVSNVMDRVRDFFPFSPAKRGPFSGRGYTTFSGKALVKDFAKGMETQAATVQRAASTVMGAAGLAGTTGTGSALAGHGVAGTQVTINGNVGWDPAEMAAELNTRIQRSQLMHNIRRITKVA